MLYQEENVIWDKLYEAAKFTILVDPKTPYNPSTYVNFHGVTLGDLIKAGFYQFDSCDTPNGPSNNDIIDKDHNTDNYGDTPMILTNLSKRYKVSPVDIIKVLYNPNPYSTQVMKELIIDVKLYGRINTAFIYISIHNHTYCQSLVDRGDNVGVSGQYVAVANTSPHMHVNIR